MYSERERVIAYLEGRVRSAWAGCKDEEACDCLRFLEALEEMSDEDFEVEFSEAAEVS